MVFYPALWTRNVEVHQTRLARCRFDHSVFIANVTDERMLAMLTRWTLRCGCRNSTVRSGALGSALACIRRPA